MVKPNALTPRPTLIPLVILGGLVATLLLTSLVYLAPVAGFEFIDYPRLIGGLFSGDPDVAFWVGYWIFFAAGVFVFAPLLAITWASLPGPGVGFAAGLAKGLIWGILLWVVAGLLLWLLGAINQLSASELEAPGPFAVELGLLAAVGLLLGHVLYALTVALIGTMGQGISPIDTLGWVGYGTGVKEEVLPRRPASVGDRHP